MNTSVLRTATASVVVVAVLFGSAGCSLLGKQPRDAAGNLTATASLSASQLRVGDCLLDVNTVGATVNKVTAVPCSTPHNGEVYAVGTKVLASTQSVAEQFCTDNFEAYIGIPIEDTTLDISYVHPQSASDTNKTITCIVAHADGSKDSVSLKGSKQ